uniref:Uncharacterized protein n=1 Tax=Ficedula albicollis TaxID=59894 RepID=A0A803WFC7_FICAL
MPIKILIPSSQVLLPQPFAPHSTMIIFLSYVLNQTLILLVLPPIISDKSFTQCFLNARILLKCNQSIFYVIFFFKHIIIADNSSSKDQVWVLITDMEGKRHSDSQVEQLYFCKRTIKCNDHRHGGYKVFTVSL